LSEDWSKWLKVVELGLIVLVAMKVFGQFWQKREDVGTANATAIQDLCQQVYKIKESLQEVREWRAADVARQEMLTELTAHFKSLDVYVQDLRGIRIAHRLSVVESAQENFEKHVYREYLSKEMCREKMAAVLREHNGYHPTRKVD
jgi:plasmid replication initiation protein